MAKRKKKLKKKMRIKERNYLFKISKYYVLIGVIIAYLISYFVGNVLGESKWSYIVDSVLRRS